MEIIFPFFLFNGRARTNANRMACCCERQHAVTKKRHHRSGSGGPLLLLLLLLGTYFPGVVGKPANQSASELVSESVSDCVRCGGATPSSYRNWAAKSELSSGLWLVNGIVACFLFRWNRFVVLLLSSFLTSTCVGVCCC